MNFSLSEEQRLLIETARKFVYDELIPLEDQIEREGKLDPAKAKAIFEKSRALGLYAVNIPEKHGGAGLSTVDTCLVEEQFGHAMDILVRRAFGNVYEVLLLANPAQVKTYLEPATRGERTFSVCFTEPGAGSDAAGIKTRAERKGNGWVLNGQKTFISDGLFSDFFVVSAVTDASAGARGITLFIVDKGMPGFTIGRNLPMMGLSGTSHVELFFDNVELPADAVLGKEGAGLKHALETLGRIRLAHIGARAVGRATRILNMATEYARERKQFGKTIGEFQMVQQMLADSAIEINAARMLVLQTAFALDQGEDARERISMVKIYAPEMLGRVADRAVQIFGGMGYCKDLPIERFYRDARISRIYDGTSEIHRTVIARSMLKQGARPFADVI
ncbi:MAG TPA: acyl-CoA dehydrogenase family protein [Pseudorhodoplanes sp.]|nr:acyl-CoA dehydrogenase family protein [Pseudorhodoplanes sp.]